MQLTEKKYLINQGLAGKRITPSMAVIGIILIWTYSIGITIGPFFGWGDYMVEGLLISCTYDFLTPVSFF